MLRTSQFRIAALILSSLGLMLASGCAFGTRHAKIVYPPEASSKSEVAPIAAPAGSQGKIILQSFGDERADKRVVGHVRNGWGMKTAEVVCDDDLSKVVAGAVRHELEQAGYEVLSPDASDSDALPSMSGGLVVLYCDAYLSYEGAATLHVTISRSGREVFRQSYQGKGSVGMNWAATGASYGRSLSLALKDALENLKRDLPHALKH